MSAERLRPGFPAESPVEPLLQRTLPESGGKMEGVEGQGAISTNRQWEASPARSEPQIQNPAEGTEETKSRNSRRREGHHKKIFFHAPVIVRGDMRNSNAVGGRRCSDSVPMLVGALWNGFWSGRGVGGSATPVGNEIPLI